ncbi:MAG: ribosome maturation factor RimP [Thermoleophilia bacterium]|nr:ribosome maturation factor RimP [Thermoleophilia bacterium]
MSTHFDRERELQARIAAELSEALPEIEVVEVELDEPRETVRIFIDRAEGIGFEHCEEVSHAIHDLVPEHELEVSSPGMERPLRSPESFTAVIGEQVRLRRAGAHKAGQFQVVSVDDAGVTVRPDGGEELLVPFDKIVRCRLVVGDFFAKSGKAERKARKKGRT